MVSKKMYCLLVVTFLAIVFVDNGIANIRASTSAKWMPICPPEKVLILHGNSLRCYEKCERCPNGYCYGNNCYCFPGRGRDESGVCEKICNDCENGWCSSVSKCECNEGFALFQGRCVHPLCDQQENPEPPLLQYMGSFANQWNAARNQQSSQGSRQYQSCQTDYLWDPETRSCIPYESAKAPEINMRMSD